MTAQEPWPTDDARAAYLLEQARQIVDAVRYCWAGTQGDQTPSLRVVEPFQSLSEGGWTLGFLTSRSSRKAAELASLPAMALGFQYDLEFAYVTLLGHGVIVDDREAVMAHWREAWFQFFPDGPSNLDAIVVTMRVERVEMWNPVRKIAPAPYGLRAAVLECDHNQRWTCRAS